MQKAKRPAPGDPGRQCACGQSLRRASPGVRLSSVGRLREVSPAVLAEIVRGALIVEIVAVASISKPRAVAGWGDRATEVAAVILGRQGGGSLQSLMNAGVRMPDIEP